MAIGIKILLEYGYTRLSVTSQTKWNMPESHNRWTIPITLDRYRG